METIMAATANRLYNTTGNIYIIFKDTKEPVTDFTGPKKFSWSNPATNWVCIFVEISQEMVLWYGRYGTLIDRSVCTCGWARVPRHVADSTTVSRPVIKRSLSMTCNIIIIAPITIYHIASVLLAAPISKHFRTWSAASPVSEGRPKFSCRTGKIYRPVNKWKTGPPAHLKRNQTSANSG